MVYMGSKNRIAGKILPIILNERKEGQYYVEPFVGGANMIDKVNGNRIGSDSNEYIIELWKSLQQGWNPPSKITKEEYDNARNDKQVDAITAFIGFSATYSGKWFGGYARGKDSNGNDRNYVNERRNNILKQVDRLKDVEFVHSSYCDLFIPDNSIIYCDPPYESTTGYKDSFNHGEFWEWCRRMKSIGHTIFVSEYNAPDDFVCVWEAELVSSLVGIGSKKSTEKLFTL